MDTPTLFRILMSIATLACLASAYMSYRQLKILDEMQDDLYREEESAADRYKIRNLDFDKLSYFD